MRNVKSYWLMMAALSIMLILSLGGGLWGADQSIGHWTGKLFERVCHQDPMRSFSVFGTSMAVNSRCFGVFFGLWLGWVAIPFFIQYSINTGWVKWILLVAVMLQIIDYTGNHVLWENTNISRYILGLILGLAVSLYLSDFFKQIEKR